MFLLISMILPWKSFEIELLLLLERKIRLFGVCVTRFTALPTLITSDNQILSWVSFYDEKKTTHQRDKNRVHIKVEH